MIQKKFNSTEEDSFPMGIFDVCLGRGNFINLPGNKAYRKAVNDVKAAYQDANGSKEKAEIIIDVINKIKKSGGNFYIRKENNVKSQDEISWIIAPNDEVFKKVRQTLREKKERRGDKKRSTTITARTSRSTNDSNDDTFHSNENKFIIPGDIPRRSVFRNDFQHSDDVIAKISMDGKEESIDAIVWDLKNPTNVDDSNSNMRRISKQQQEAVSVPRSRSSSTSTFTFSSAVKTAAASTTTTTAATTTTTSDASHHATITTSNSSVTKSYLSSVLNNKWSTDRSNTSCHSSTRSRNDIITHQQSFEEIDGALFEDTPSSGILGSFDDMMMPLEGVDEEEEVLEARNNKSSGGIGE